MRLRYPAMLAVFALSAMLTWVAPASEADKPTSPENPSGMDHSMHMGGMETVSYTHLRAHETSLHLVCRLLLEKISVVLSRAAVAVA